MELCKRRGMGWGWQMTSTSNQDVVDIIDNVGSNFIGLFTICSEVLLQKTTPVIAIVFGKIWLLARTNGYCYMSREIIAKQLGIHVRTLDGAIQILCGDPEVDFGGKKIPNKYFNKDTRWIVDVTPDNYLSKHQVRYYAPIPKNIKAYVNKFETKKENEMGLTTDQLSEIHSKIKKINDEYSENLDEYSENLDEYSSDIENISQFLDEFS
jgi:hypothetical protein